MSDNCPTVSGRLEEARTVLEAIRANMDCAIELDRLNTLVKHEFLDELSFAIGSIQRAHAIIKNAKIPE